MIQQYKQVGNAVPLGLGHAVGKLIFNLLHGIEILPVDNFKYSRYKNTSDSDWKMQFDREILAHQVIPV